MEKKQITIGVGCTTIWEWIEEQQVELSGSGISGSGMTRTQLLGQVAKVYLPHMIVLSN